METQQEPRAAQNGKHSRTVPTSIQVTMITAIVLGLLFVGPYLGVIFISALLAFAFNPIYQWLLKRIKKQGLALTTTVVIAVIIVILPIALISVVTVNQISTLANNMSHGVNIDTDSIDKAIDSALDKVNSLLPGTIHVDKSSVLDAIGNTVKNALSNLAGSVTSVGASIVGFAASIILAIFLILAMLRYQKDLFSLFKHISPFDNSINDLYLHKAAAMTRAMIIGQFLIALAQGIASAGSLWLVGIDYFWFFVMLLSFLSFIPLGTGIITIPIGAILIFTGDIWQGIFVIAFHILAVSNIDNLLRPHLVPKDARLNTALTLLSVFSGITLFGAPGVVYGPVIMILLVTTFTMYRDFNTKQPRPGLPDKHAGAGKEKVADAARA